LITTRERGRNARSSGPPARQAHLC
jgi:hypothetical protein